VKDVEGTVIVEEETVLDTWTAYHGQLANEEFDWDNHSLSDVGRISGKVEDINCRNEGSNCKDLVFLGFLTEMLKTFGEAGQEWAAGVHLKSRMAGAKLNNSMQFY